MDTNDEYPSNQTKKFEIEQALKFDMKFQISRQAIK